MSARPGWGTIAAVRNGGVVAVSDDIASRWGPRIVDFMQAVWSIWFGKIDQPKLGDQLISKLP